MSPDESNPNSDPTQWYYAGFWWRVVASIIDNCVVQAGIGLLAKLMPINEHILGALAPLMKLKKPDTKIPAPDPLKSKGAALDMLHFVKLSATQKNLPQMTPPDAAQSKAAMMDVLHTLMTDGTLIAFFAIIIAASYLAAWLYPAIMESSIKQATLGKIVCGMKVTDLRGQRISFWRASARFWAALGVGIAIIMVVFVMLNVYFMTYGFPLALLLWPVLITAFICLWLIVNIPYFMIGWTSRKQALHDMIAGTLVYRRKPSPHPLPPPQFI